MNINLKQTSFAGLLSALADVNVPEPSDQDALIWDNGTSKWISQAIDHDALTNFLAGEHFLQSAITEVGTVETGAWEGTAIANAYIAGIDQNLLEASSPTFNLLNLTDLKTKGPTVDARAHGMATGASAANNRTYLQAAIDGAPTGGTVLVPRDSAAYSLDNTTPLTITHGLTLIIQGEIDFSEDDKDFCDVTGDDVTIIGQGGKIKGPGTFDQSGAITSAVFHVTGDRFTCLDITLEDPVQCGIWLNTSSDNIISGVKIVGGDTAYASAQNYGIQIDGAGATGILISGCYFIPNSSGGDMVQAIAGGGGTGGNIVVTGCFFDDQHEHATYLFGDHNTIVGNTINSPGGTAIKHIGKHVTIANNTINCGGNGGIEARNCDQGVITGNTINDFNYIGIDVCEYTVYAGVFDNIVIANNTMTGKGSGTVYCGIRVNGSDCGGENLQVTNNIVRDADSSSAHYCGISVYCDAGDFMSRVKIDGNIVDTTGDAGIFAREIKWGSISNNLIRDPAQDASPVYAQGIRLHANSTYVTIADNQILKETGAVAMDYGIQITASASNANCIVRNNTVIGDGTGEVLADRSEGHQLFLTGSDMTTWLPGDLMVGYSDTAKISLMNASGAERAFLQLYGASGVGLDIRADSAIKVSPNNTYSTAFLPDGGVTMVALKSGANQGAAGAAANELWVDTADQTIKLGA